MVIMSSSEKGMRILQFLIHELELPCAEAISRLEVEIAAGEPLKVRLEGHPLDREQDHKDTDAEWEATTPVGRVA